MFIFYIEIVAAIAGVLHIQVCSARKGVLPVIEEKLMYAGWFMRYHKFHAFDARYFDETGRRLDNEDIKGEPSFMYQFPDPPLQSFLFHDDLKLSCEKGFEQCLDHVAEVAKNAYIKGGTQGASDAKLPFVNFMEKFTYRATAAYYLCWYTMKKHPHLKYFGKACPQQRGHKIETSDNEYHQDWRASDNTEFGCAQFSFCPDPCCGRAKKRHGTQGIFSRMSECWFSSTNPCKGIGKSECFLDADNNMDFARLQKEPLNTTCDCKLSKGRGYSWNSKAGTCVDVDECYEGSHDCKGETICRNQIGGFMCSCKLSYKYDHSSMKCLQTIDLDKPMSQEVVLTHGQAPEPDDPYAKFDSWKYWALEYVGITAGGARPSVFGCSFWVSIVMLAAVWWLL